MVQKTALNDYHREIGARMVDFAGWDMPIQFKSIINEHLAVRKNCGVFDCSHMGQFFVTGAQAESFVEQLITNSLSKIDVGKAIYSPMLFENGTFVDDLIVYWLDQNSFMFVVNASNIDKDLTWMKDVAEKMGGDIQIQNRSDELSLLAVQGPKSPEFLEKVLALDFQSMKPFGFMEMDFDGVKGWCCRTGYTGELGVELVIPNEVAVETLKALVEAGVEPCGLGARDLLRLEKGYSLYGHEIDDSNDPLSTGLQWTVDMKKEVFIGKSALENMIKNGHQKKLVGYKVEGRALARHGAKVFSSDGREIGVVTSGAFSPTLKQGIGLAYIEASHDADDLLLEVRQKKIEAKLHSRTFV
jgi:aminomethyltransferase